MNSFYIKTKSLNKNQVKLLDFLRGFSALMVLFAHCQQIFINPYWYPHKKLDVDLIWVVYRHIGSFAVMIFFVLSGFLIYLSIGRNIANNQANYFDLKRFAISRLVRLYPPLIISIIFTILIYSIVFWCGLTDRESFTVGGEIYLARSQLSMEVNNIIGSLAYLNTMVSWIKTPVMNGALWSIAHEFWYYVIAGLAVASFSSNRLSVRAAFIFVGYWLIENANSFWFYGLGVWVAGAYAAWAFTNWNIVKVKAFNYLLLIVAGCFWLYMLAQSDNSGFYNNRQKFSFGFFLACLFPIILDLRLEITNFCFFSIFSKVAPFAYSLYVLHFPFLLLVFVLFNKYTAGSPGFLVLMVIGSACSIIYISFLVGRRIENKKFLLYLTLLFYSKKNIGR